MSCPSQAETCFVAMHSQGSGPADPALLAKLAAILEQGGADCAICLEELNAPCITPCAHAYCRRRAVAWALHDDRLLCPSLPLNDVFGCWLPHNNAVSVV